MAEQPKTNYTQDEVNALIKQKEDELKRRFARVVPEQSADYERVMKENQTTIRDNANMDTTLKAIGAHTSNAMKNVVWLFTSFEKDFITTDNFIQQMNTPKRNYPLIILGVIGLVGGAILLSRFSDFSAWYGSGFNWVIFWGGIITVGLGYRFYRNRQKKGVQTSPI